MVWGCNGKSHPPLHHHHPFCPERTLCGTKRDPVCVCAHASVHVYVYVCTQIKAVRLFFHGSMHMCGCVCMHVDEDVCVCAWEQNTKRNKMCRLQFCFYFYLNFFCILDQYLKHKEEHLHTWDITRLNHMLIPITQDTDWQSDFLVAKWDEHLTLIWQRELCAKRAMFIHSAWRKGEVMLNKKKWEYEERMAVLICGQCVSEERQTHPA